MSNHPCAGKCSEFKDGSQCFYCLINETVNRGVYSMHRTEHRINTNDMGDDTHIENHISPHCRINCFQDDTEIGTRTVDIEAENERLKTENLAMQAKVDELQAENKMLHEAAATHLRNQNQFMGLYNRLVEQLYPYAIDLEDPVDGDVNTPKEYMDGYNRARECVHYNLLEMMESDVEYICAQCDMLGGGGEA